MPQHLTQHPTGHSTGHSTGHPTEHPPGTRRDPALHARLEAAYAARGPDYKPRTHLLADGRARYVNRLIEEASPYLLQHAHNPVDWYPWGDEALQLAEQENKPLFISIGYSACHWCHVMERESFEDPKVAEQMNRDFVCIKVDREERPDLDAIYMDAVQGLTGQGGWPMSVFASPEGIPFFGGTYFPPDDRHGLPSFSKVLNGVAKAWTENGDRMVEGGKQRPESSQGRS